MRWSLNSSYRINIQSEKLSRLNRTVLLATKATISSKIPSERLSIDQLEDFFLIRWNMKFLRK